MRKAEDDVGQLDNLLRAGILPGSKITLKVARQFGEGMYHFADRENAVINRLKERAKLGVQYTLARERRPNGDTTFTIWVEGDEDQPVPAQTLAPHQKGVVVEEDRPVNVAQYLPVSKPTILVPGSVVRLKGQTTRMTVAGVCLEQDFVTVMWFDSHNGLHQRDVPVALLEKDE